MPQQRARALRWFARGFLVYDVIYTRDRHPPTKLVTMSAPVHLPLVWKGLKKDTVVGLFVYHQDHAKRCVDLTIFLPSDWLFRDKNENSEKEPV